jgi:hypothetical protein
MTVVLAKSQAFIRHLSPSPVIVGLVDGELLAAATE